ncbi:unnamed protein product [Lepidochelys olivacea]
MGWEYPESAQLRAAAASASGAHAIKTEQTAADSSLTQQFKKPRLRGSSGPAPVQQTAFGTETDSHQSLNLPPVGQNPSVDPVPISQRGGFATAMEECLPSAAALRVQTQPYCNTPGSTLHPVCRGGKRQHAAQETGKFRPTERRATLKSNSVEVARWVPGVYDVGQFASKKDLEGHPLCSPNLPALQTHTGSYDSSGGGRE